MGRQKRTPARAEPTLPEGAPRVCLAAPAGQPSAHFESSAPVTLIGSRRDCDLFVGRDDVSKVHCALVNTGSAIIAVDLCGRSGTFVNGQRVSAAALHPGDNLCVGSVRIEVRFLDAAEHLTTGTAGAEEANLALPVPLRLTSVEQQYELARLPAVIGRRHACQVLLDTPDVSLAHALLFTVAGCPAIFDLGSRSGTYLNGQRVTLAWLRDGDQLRIGGEELSLAWEGPHAAECEAGSAGLGARLEPPDTTNTTAPLELNGFTDLGSMIEGLRAQIGASHTRLAERAAVLRQREAELEARISTLENERVRLALEEQQFEQRAAELRAAMAELEQERTRFDAQRADFERQRSQLEAQRAELEQRLATHQATASELQERERTLEQRRAALAAAEQELTRKQAELAEREATSEEPARRGKRLRDALRVARRVFTSVETFPEQPAEPDDRPVPSASPARESADQASSGAEAALEQGDLPAPLVEKPLFGGLDPASPEQWPPELQERLQLLCRERGRTDADAISQVLAEYQARQLDQRSSSGN